MKTKLYISILAISLFVNGLCQNPTIELSFSAIDNTTYIQLDSIKVVNQTQGGDTVLHWPDTVLVLEYQLGVDNIENVAKDFKLFQNFPNPVTDKTTIHMFIPEKDDVSIIISDVAGNKLFTVKKNLEMGTHAFQFVPDNSKVIFVSAIYRNVLRSIQIINTGKKPTSKSSFEYIGLINNNLPYKSSQNTDFFIFNPGDILLYVVYVNGLESGWISSLENEYNFTFQFATGIPCPGTPTVDYQGQIYNTVQIYNQCWFKDNLNWDTGTSWCYNNELANCDTLGRLYNWSTALSVCPEGWHLPSDSEWKILEGAVDSQYGIGSSEWNEMTSYRGYDAGLNLKSSTGWTDSMNGPDQLGFSGKPAGLRHTNGDFYFKSDRFVFQSSTAENDTMSFFRDVYYSFDGIWRDAYDKEYGYSVRCLKD